MSRHFKIGLTILLLVIVSLLSISLIYNKKFFLLVVLGLTVVYTIFLLISIRDMKKRSTFTKRNRIVIFIITFFIMIIFLRLVQIQIFDKSKYVSMMNSQILSVNKEEGERGIIYDSTGKKLAFNKRLYTMHINPNLLNDEKYSADLLKDVELIVESKLVKIDENIIKELKEMASQNKKYKVLAKNIDDDTKDKIDELIETYHKEQGKKSYKSPIVYDKSIERIYYQEKEYEKLIGMVKFTDNSTSKLGISGIEKQYEDYLVERKRAISKLYGLNKKTILPLSKDTVYSDLNGKNLHLTIDSNINYILNDEMKIQFEETQAREAYGIVMDPNSGRILGIAALSRDKKLLRNNIFQSQYEPGSIFKPIIVSAALNEGLISKNSKFDVGNGSIVKYRKTIKESSRTTKGVLTTTQVIMKSSNVGMVLISDYFSDQLFEEYLKKFGLYDKTNIDFPDELKPYTIPYQKWDKLKKNNMAFGQGIVVSPIQMAVAFSAVVNGGTMYKPYLVDKITDNDGVVIMRNTPEKVREVIKPEVSEMVRGMLEETVSAGTGKRAYIEGYRLGGKTGTAQLSAGKSGYEKNEYLASFIGFFPADKPKYVVLVMFMRPQGDAQFKKFGGYVSAPVVGNIARRIIKDDKVLSQNISKLNSQIGTVQNTKKAVTTDEGNIMPDLTGISLREVIELFGNDEDIELEITGTGLVKEQQPKAGEDLENVSKIKIILE
ncbi:MAG: penicillin-binding protein [Fusobacterium gastrosuis]|uniref:penicillin-binding protein n=1 Tax=Fusobacterium gastrosuis TaxID=1755100 RepID=UPI002A852BE9|nr:penicillin-binding protein [Fusobacterium gastrosuis]